MLLRCTNVIAGNFTRQIILLNSICANLSPTKCLSVKKDFWKMSNLDVYLGMFNMILKYEILREALANFPPIFRNINVGRDDIGPLMKEYAEKRLLSQSRRMLISSFFWENGTFIAPLLLLYPDLGLVCKKNYRFVQYTPMKCFNNFVQSAVNARREGDEIPNSSVVAENEVTSKHLLWLPDHGSDSTYSNKVSQ